MSEIMLQQTTVAAVTNYFIKFISLWPTVEDLANAKDADVMAEWAGLGYYARARNLLKCARVIASDYNGIFPNTYDKLIKLPGIGPYTAGAISSIAFDKPTVVVDGNVERVMSRLFNIHTPLPRSKPELNEKAQALTPNLRPGDYAQAVMDLGATICIPRNPQCEICPWRSNCTAHAKGEMNELPKKIPKKSKPTRYGIAYVVRRADGAWLLETRPEKGLLGGMLGWPSTDWCDNPEPDPPAGLSWIIHNDVAKHTFTHFHLYLKVAMAEAPQTYHPQKGEFVPNQEFNLSNLPTVMRKVFNIVYNHSDLIE